MKGIFNLIGALSIITCAHSAFAELERGDRSIQVVGRKEVVVTTATVSLGDIAQISSPRMIDDEAVIGLKKIPLDKAPAPGDVLTLSAAGILEKMRDSGVDLNGVGYAIPRIIKVSRASRTITLDEVKGAIDEFIKSSGKDVVVKDVSLPEQVHLIPGITKIKAIAFPSAVPGKMTFGLAAHVPGATDVRFNVDATVDEWREVPVARRPLSRGEVVGSEDVMMARLNMAAVPKDAALSDDKVVGLAINASLGSGEFFRRDKLLTPMVIEAGARVTMMYRSKNFEATAKGTALEGGSVGQEIKVRNETSKKIIAGKVVEAGLIEVIP